MGSGKEEPGLDVRCVSPFFMSSNLFSTNRKKGYEDLTEIQMLLEFRTGISISILALSLSVSKCLVHYFTYKKSVAP